MKVNLGLLLLPLPFFLSFVIVYGYRTAVRLGHVHPFPYTDITHTAIKYPQYVLYRVVLIAIWPLISLSYYAIRVYLDQCWTRVFGGVQPLSKIILQYGGILAGGMLAVSFAAISDGHKFGKDESDMNWSLHVTGATFFYVSQILFFFYLSNRFNKLAEFGDFMSHRTLALLDLNGLATLALLGFLGLKHLMGWLNNHAAEWAVTLWIIICYISILLDMQRLSLVLVPE